MSGTQCSGKNLFFFWGKIDTAWTNRVTVAEGEISTEVLKLGRAGEY